MRARQAARRDERQSSLYGPEHEAETAAGAPAPREGAGGPTRGEQGTFNLLARAQVPAPASARPLTRAESAPLPASIHRDPETGTLLYDREGGALLGQILRANGVTIPFGGFRTDPAGLRGVATGLRELGRSDLAATVESNPTGIFAEHAEPWTRAGVEEELTHESQGAANQGDPNHAMSKDEAAAFARALPARLRAEFERRYGKMMERAERLGLASAQQVLAAEVGARLLNWELPELGLAPEEGIRLRQEYIKGVERTWPDGWQKLFRKGIPAAQAPGAGGFSLRAKGGEHGADDGAAAGGVDLLRAERGDLLGAPRSAAAKIARAVEAAYDALGKYPGLSPQGRRVMWRSEAARETRAVALYRAARSLYDLVFKELGPDYQKDLAKLKKIQQSIVRPGEPRFSLTPAERRVRQALEGVRNQISAHDVAEGWMTPEAIEGGAEGAGAAAASLPARARATLAEALPVWQALKEDAQEWWAKKEQEAIPNQRLLFLHRVIDQPPQPQELIQQFLASGEDVPGIAGISPDAQRLVKAWVETAHAGVAAPYWPGDYTNDIADVERILAAGEHEGEREHPLANPWAQRKFMDLVEAENSGLTQNPDAVQVILRRLERSLTRAHRSQMLRDLAALGTGEVRPANVSEYRGHEVTNVEPGFRLARNLEVLNRRMDLQAIGGPDTVVSKPMAEALLTALGNGPEEASGPLAPLVNSALGPRPQRRTGIPKTVRVFAWA